MDLYRVTEVYMTNEQGDRVNEYCFDNKCTEIRLLNDCNDHQE